MLKISWSISESRVRS